MIFINKTENIFLTLTEKEEKKEKKKKTKESKNKNKQGTQYKGTHHKW